MASDGVHIEIVFDLQQALKLMRHAFGESFLLFYDFSYFESEMNLLGIELPE